MVSREGSSLRHQRVNTGNNFGTHQGQLSHLRDKKDKAQSNLWTFPGLYNHTVASLRPKPYLRSLQSEHFPLHHFGYSTE